MSLAVAMPTLLAALGGDLAGAAHQASVLDPAGNEAAEVARLWWFFFSVTAVVFVLVLGATLVALARGQSASAEGVSPPTTEMPPATERRTVIVVSTLVGLTVATLFVLLIRDFFTDRALQPPHAPNALTIRLTGHQWWWQAVYQDSTTSNVFETANEIHVPVNRPVQFMLQSSDVIHSFWLPSLCPKKDLVPGHPTAVWVTPKKTGVYYGQCAEFCGYQHANMKLYVFVNTPEDFEKWADAQRKPAPEPTTDRQRRGRDLFLTGSCVMCHAIDGTLAASHVGPSLTHLAGRQTLGAGAIANTAEELPQWIRDPQRIKPGVRMPQNALPPEDIAALSDYLASLH